MAVVSVPQSSPDARDRIALQAGPIALDPLVAWATTPGSGAVVGFLGVVRDHAEGRDDVVALTYEAYEEPARRRMAEIVAVIRDEWPDVDRVAVVHRLGRLELSETAVAVVVSSPHRAVAFAAALACIDRIKESVPIWKKEHWSDGSDWALGEQSIRALSGPTREGGVNVECSS
ncbi:MAG: molybdopterin synthase catalytic subunit [Actinomycetota bacterium]|jgi:molybdopterin synthase catalytic subunit|nr:molybdopterin synthase catalytic subunit [Actinomycetota bacterium]